MGIQEMLLQFMLVIGLILVTAVAPATAQAKAGCPDTCGNVSIPYPFGTRDGCYLNTDFLITCNTSFNPPVPFLWTSEYQIINITLDSGILIYTSIARDCYNSSGYRVLQDLSYGGIPMFPFSTTRNKFTAIGCDTNAYIEDYNGSINNTWTGTGCLTVCDNIESVTEGSCTGMGCCQTAVPKGLLDYKLTVTNFYSHLHCWSINPCSYAFLAAEGSYNFTLADLKDLQNRTRIPTVLDWAVGNHTCEEAKRNSTSYVCQAYSQCYDSQNGPGYLCNCSVGFQGNPYHPTGCQDIDECADRSLNQCEKNCINTVGSYTCSCPKGYKGDGRRDGDGCNQTQSRVLKVSLGTSLSLLVLLLVSAWLYWVLQQRKLTELKKKFFEKNGGLMLQQQLSKDGESGGTFKIFTAGELKSATDNYHQSRVLGQGGQGTVYKGTLPDSKLVAIKKSRIGDQSESQIQQFVNEVLVLSQINHRNVVKLLGCCLETEVPLLVYEYVTNGTLFDRIHNARRYGSSMPWETRLSIVTDTAETLWYLHSSASPPIIHRDVKTANILLDENFTAKVSDFGASKLVPQDKANLDTLVQGTLGYLDPEYLQSNLLTEKSDVYSFGVVLVELLTGKVAFSFERPEEEKNLAMYFISSGKEDRLFEIIDSQVKNEKYVEQIKKVAMLANRCLRIKGEERPSMKEVTMELETLRAIEKQGEKNLEVTESLSSELPSTFSTPGNTSNVTVYDSIRNEVRLAFSDAR